jgi:exopolyphosphatase/guanosine-5'-triphosphate,3'-diphosphate pyrophosphatase
VNVGVVDIGTNSVRLLITDGKVEQGRWVKVTGLGRGVDSTGVLSEEPMAESVRALAGFGTLMADLGVQHRKAIATSAARDAANRDEFFEMAEMALGVRPTLISGEEEARLAYAGTVSAFELEGSVLVSDIGGGSTEFVRSASSISRDIGSVRLSDRVLKDHPASPSQMRIATEMVAGLFENLSMARANNLVGVAGTWTSLAAIVLGLGSYDSEVVHGSVLIRRDVEATVDRLAGMSLEEKAAIPSLHPKRAPVILSGAVVAAGVLAALGATEVVISERDTLDGLAAELLALP